MKPRSGLKIVFITLGLSCLIPNIAFGALFYWMTGPGYDAELKAVKLKR